MTNVLIATSEAVPFAKTGGLADVCGALPAELAALGQGVSLIMPAYRGVYTSGIKLEDTGAILEIPLGKQAARGKILRGQTAEGITVYFVEQRDYFDRPDLYGEKGVDYRDNCERFVYFCRAVLDTIRLLDLKIDLIHCNDWQTALIPVLLDAEYRVAAGYETLATLLTIHNLAYQGRFWHWDMLLTGLDWKYFDWRRLEYYGDLNLLKGGIVFADALNTVSPRYAEEIQTTAFGCGLESVLRQRRDQLCGILNGCDYRIWNPATDPHLPLNYDLRSWLAGKAACKSSLQSALGLSPDPAIPLLGVVGRLVEQKGLDLILEVMERWTRTEQVQWVILGTGQPRIESKLMELARDYPQRVAARIEFSNALAHQIEAAADIFLMPSRYEPCGLNQLYSLKYGTVPLVHATGGLYDTVENCTRDTLDEGTGTGFVFDDYDVQAFADTLTWALKCFGQPQVWQRIVQNGMAQDWSWRRSARQYVDLYQKTIEQVKQTICA